MGTIGSQFLRQDFEECMASVRKAEEAGYSHAWFIDSQILWQDCFVYMTHALAATERIVVGTAVTNPYTRHVTTTASAFATLAELHPGPARARHRARRQRGADDGPRTRSRRPCSRSRLPVLRELMAGRHVDDQRRRRAPPLGRARIRGIPIMMAATGPEEPARSPARWPTA